ncbi:MAG: hypothetical protein IVW54_15140 [Candidatus Binataceae bacterium]|nr:hypothetical protein [Candidatus Binataceae bacterium]
MKRSNKGQIAVIVALVLPVLIGAIALGTDVAIFYFNWVQLQKAADAGVLGGANYLPDNPNQAVASANQLAETDGVASGEIVSTTVASNDLSITMQVKRQVPYYFARVLGLSNGSVAATATAAAPYAPSTVNAGTPSQVPPGGDNGATNGSFGSSVGQNGLMPIGLDYNTVYNDGQQITLQQGQVGHGNWDLLALGGVGGANLRANIANGYTGQISVGDWVNTEPGIKVGPVDQGFQDRLNAAQLSDPSGTYASHALNDPRVLIVPVVDWENPNGRQAVLVKAFATVWLDGYNGGYVTVNFISQVIANSFGDPNAPGYGSRGTPILIK